MAMTVQCTSCSTSFPVDPAKVPPGGVQARCSACGTIFRVERPSGPAEPAPRSPDTPAAGGGSEPFSGPTGTETTAPSPGAPSFEAPAGPGSSPTPSAGPEAPSFGDAAGSASPAVPGDDSDWTVEREPEIDASDVQVDRLDTVEESVRSAQDTWGSPGDTGSAPAAGEAPVPGAPEAGGAGTTFTPEPPPPAEGTPGEAAPTPSTPPVQGFTFGRRDPHEKASRLARVLVSDMVTYNSERHERALSQGTLEEDFEDEIKKSWDEYVEQVGRDIAESTSFFNDALNEILARGRQVF